MAGNWSNEAYRFICERVGDEECERMRQREYLPLPYPRLYSRLGLYLGTKLLNAAASLKSFKLRQRPTHKEGVGGLGIAKISDNSGIPSNTFFTAGRVFQVRMRHANLSYDDDRTLDVRSASIKFADNDVDSPLDLIMNTGDRCPFWNGPTVGDYRTSRLGPQEMEEWCFKNSAYYYNTIQGLRRAPSSYSNLRYYAQMTFELIDVHNDTHYVRFRLVPYDYSQIESGLPDAADQKEPWNHGPQPGDDRQPNYLKSQYKEALFDQSINYRLQIQFYHNPLLDDLEVFNMGKVWDETISPWTDIAEITIFRFCEPRITERTCFNVSHLPDCLVLPVAPSFQDYRSIGHLRREVYYASQWARQRHGLSRSCVDFVHVRYRLAVKTGMTSRAGYDGMVHVSITGSDGRTDPVKLDKTSLFGDNFCDGEDDIFQLEACDVGRIRYIQFDLDNPTDGWYVEMVTIEKEGQICYFPAYQWIYGSTIIRTGEAVLPFQDNDEMQALRELEKQKWRDQLPWYKWESMPSYADITLHCDLPRDVQFLDEKYRDFYAGRDEGLRNFMLNKFIGLFKDIDSFHSFTEFFRYKVGGGAIPSVAERWMSDREFGRQFLQGAHPTFFSQISELPENFQVKDEDVAGVLGRGVTLQQEMKAGRVYLVDYKTLEGIRIVEDRCVTPAMALFYVNGAGSFVPLAIQLYQNPGPANPIWTPHDKDADWLCAKLYLKCADAQLHQMQDHLLMTHLIMEPIAISLYRNISCVHPIFKLLIPHIRYIMAINTIGRKGLIGKDGLADQILAIGKGGHIELIMKCYRKFDFNNLKLPLQLAKRGVMDFNSLPSYYYRDDALQLWIAIKSFVEEIIDIYYRCDEEVKKDNEIQDWMAELHETGLPQHGLDGEVDHHVPHQMQSVVDLIEFLTVVIFTCSCEHAAQNFGQFDYYSFHPNYPMLLRQPPPKEKGKTTMDHLLKVLGHTDHVCVQVATVWLLSGFSEDELFLGDYPNQYFHEQDARSAIHRFQEHLRNIDAAIDERNHHLEVPYIYLKPSRVPNSIAV